MKRFLFVIFILFFVGSVFILILELVLVPLSEGDVAESGGEVSLHRKLKQ